MTEPQDSTAEERALLRQQIASEAIHEAELGPGPRWWVRRRVANTRRYWQGAADRANAKDCD